MTTNRSNVVLVIVVVAAIAMASVVAVHGRGSAGTTAQSTYGAENPAAAGLADTSRVASSTGSGLAAADPAKQDPTLDQFTSRNPFIQATAVPSTGPSASPTPSSSPAPSAPAANIRVSWPSGTVTYTLQRVGAELPPSSSVFKITAIFSSAGVAFSLVHGYTIVGSGATRIGPIAESLIPTPFNVEKGSKETACSITVLWIGTASSSSTSGTSGSTGSAASHSIEATAIATHNGVPGATLVVDGTTFAARKVGDVMTTSWGQIKILGITGPAQTVTILHADVQITLRVGQSVSS